MVDGLNEDNKDNKEIDDPWTNNDTCKYIDALIFLKHLKDLKLLSKDISVEEADVLIKHFVKKEYSILHQKFHTK